MRIGLRVYFYSMFVIAAALALLALMSIVKYENILSETLAKRLTIVTEDARAAIEKAGSLGVSLRSLAQQSNGPLDAAARLLPDDVLVAAVNAQGDVTRLMNGQDNLPFSSDMLREKIAAERADWHIRADDFLVAGSTIVNSFGEAEGAILAIQPYTLVEQRSTAMLWRIATFMLIALVPIAIVTAVVVFLSLRPLGRSISAMRSVVEGRELPQSAQDNEPLAPTLRWFDETFGVLEQQHGRALYALKRIEDIAVSEGYRNGK